MEGASPHLNFHSNELGTGSTGRDFVIDIFGYMLLNLIL